MNDLDLENQLKVCLMEKHLVKLDGVMSCNKTSSFGQSTTVTPVQMLQAQSAFFNDGNMLKPWFVNSVENPVSKRQFYKGQNKSQANQ